MSLWAVSPRRRCPASEVVWADRRILIPPRPGSKRCGRYPAQSVTLRASMDQQRALWAPVPRFAARVLGIRPGELERGVLLFSYLFLVIGSFVAGKATRDALFLFRFSARQLPYVDIAVALLVGVWVAIYIRIGQRVSVRTLIGGSLVFFASNSVLFWFLSRRHDVGGVGAAGRLRLGRHVWRRGSGAGVDAGELRPHHARGQAIVRLHRQRCDLRQHRRRLRGAAHRDAVRR